MSTFKTSIPVDVAAVIGLLPEHSHVEAITLDTTEGQPPAVVLQWSNHRLKTPYSVPHDFPVANLETKSLPENTTIEDWPPKPKAAPVATAAKPEPAKPTAQPKICNSCGTVAPPTRFDGNLKFCSEKCYREHRDRVMARVEQLAARGLRPQKPAAKPKTIKPLEVAND